MRERRKSFYAAQRRIATQKDEPSSQSTMASSQKRPRRGQMHQSDPPQSNGRVEVPKSSGRVKPTNALAVRNNNNVISKNRPNSQSNTAKGPTNLKKIKNVIDIDKLRTDQTVKIVKPCVVKKRRVTVALDRIAPEVLDRYRTNDNNVQQNISVSQPVQRLPPDLHKIATRRYTVTLDRMDFSKYRNTLPPIPEATPPDAASSVLVQKPRQPPINVPTKTFDIMSRLLPSVVSNRMEIDDNGPAHMEDLSDTFEESEIQLKNLRLDDQDDADDETEMTDISHKSTQSDATYLTQATVITAHRKPQRPILSDSDTSTHESLGHVIPVAQQQLLSSQTREPVSWLINNSVSDNSLIVNPSKSSNASLSDSSLVEPRIGFIDSPHVSYEAIVRSERTQFSVNQFDESDKSVQHFFLSKFSRTHFAALNASFRGRLFVTAITARLLLEYSNVRKNQIHVLEYDKKYTIKDMKVTAIEVPNFPGGALFLFESESNNNKKSILHVSDFRLSSDLENNAQLIYGVDEICFDKAILSQIFYQFPACTDRYVDLLNEIHMYKSQSEQNGLSYLVAVGAFEIGMEFFILHLAVNFSCKVYMSEERCQFLENMDPDNDSETIQKLKQQIVQCPEQAMIHVFDVDKISHENLVRYIGKHNYHRVLGIRPRGCDAIVQTVVDGTNKIVDIANPLIGDVGEYKKFVQIHTTSNTLPAPTDHGPPSERRRRSTNQNGH